MTALPRQLSRVGKRGARWQDWQKRQRAIVMQRCRGKCEFPSCRAEAREGHHVFRRRRLSEPLASHASLLAGLCKPHHRWVTDHPGDDEDCGLMWEALLRVLRDFPVRVTMGDVLDAADGESILNAARELERILKADTETWQALLEEAGVA